MHHHKETFEEICELVKAVDANGDAIHQTLKLRTLSEKFRVSVKDEKLVSEIFDMLNARSLDDENFILSFVYVITSRQFDEFNVGGKGLRSAMLGILQKNFQNADKYKRDNMNKFHNSIRLLGEYFNKARLANGGTINIIGQSLLNLINVELEKEPRNICHLKDDTFAKLILSQIALNGNLLKIRHKTEIEQVLFTIRKCLIELDNLSPKTKALLMMTLDLYYSNFNNVGDALENMYEKFLLEDIKVAAKTTPVENGKATKTPENGKLTKTPENGRVNASIERLSISKKTEEGRKSNNAPRNLRVQIGRSDPKRNGPESPRKAPQKPSTPNRFSPQSPLRTSPPTRSASQPPQKNHPPTRSSSQPPLKTSPPYRANPQSPKKRSPQELRSKKSPPVNETKSSPRYENAIERTKVQSRNSFEQREDPEVPIQNGNDENVLRQQNSRSSTPSSAAPAKYKVNNKVYFREENVENLTWNGEASFDGDASFDDPDASTSPKVNPYSSSFLNFLSSN